MDDLVVKSDSEDDDDSDGSYEKLDAGDDGAADGLYLAERKAYRSRRDKWLVGRPWPAWRLFSFVRFTLHLLWRACFSHRGSFRKKGSASICSCKRR